MHVHLRIDEAMEIDVYAIKRSKYQPWYVRR